MPKGAAVSTESRCSDEISCVVSVWSSGGNNRHFARREYMDFWIELRMYAGAAISVFTAVLCGASFVHLEAGMIVVEVVGGLFNIGVALLGTGLMILMTASIVEGVKEWVEDLADR